MKPKLHCHTLQVLTRYDAYHNVLLDWYFTKEYRHASGTSKSLAMRADSSIGPYDSYGSVHRIPNCSQHQQ